MAYDEKCYELAVYFAEDEKPPLSEAELCHLAQEIQDVIEAFLNYGRGK